MEGATISKIASTRFNASSYSISATPFARNGPCSGSYPKFPHNKYKAFWCRANEAIIGSKKGETFRRDHKIRLSFLS
jgi:hypothetical protein